MLLKIFLFFLIIRVLKISTAEKRIRPKKVDKTTKRKKVKKSENYWTSRWDTVHDPNYGGY
jgi:Na+-transporting methylmalonyl-CoA/oxaloacetate decarboxylase gamma subunit